MVVQIAFRMSSSEAFAAMMRRMSERVTVAVAATAFAAGSALAGGMCAGQSHEVSAPTQTVSTETDGPMTAVETTTQEVQ